MKIISNGDKLSVFVINNKDIDLNNLDMYMKELIIKLRRKYRKDIYGFYKVDVYIKDKIGMIIDFNLEEEIDFFRDLVDLKVVVHEEADVFLKFSDYFLFDKKKAPPKKCFSFALTLLFRTSQINKMFESFLTVYTQASQKPCLPYSSDSSLLTF